MMKGFWWNALMVSTVCLGVLGCSGTDKELEDESLLELLEGLDLSENVLLQPNETHSQLPPYGPPRPVDPRVEEERKAAKRALMQRLNMKRDVTRVGGQGQVEEPAVAKVLARHRARLTRCYEIIVRDAPGLHGRVGVRFTIHTKGHLKDVLVTENTTESEPLGSCIEQRLRRVRFPEPEGGVAEFTWSMDLAAPEG